MSRSGYTDDCDEDYPNAWALYRGAVESSIRGKRGQSFLLEMLGVMDSMEPKRLVSHVLVNQAGEVCALGCVGVSRGMTEELRLYDVEDSWHARPLARDLKISEALVREIEWINDDDHHGPPETPEQRFIRVRAWVVRQLQK